MASKLFILVRKCIKRSIMPMNITVLPAFKIIKINSWCEERKQNCPHFQYWNTVLELQISLLVYVRSLREANFDVYLDALTELVPWFFAFDHTNNARWIPVHLRDMAELPEKHPSTSAKSSKLVILQCKKPNEYSQLSP